MRQKIDTWGNPNKKTCLNLLLKNKKFFIWMGVSQIIAYSGYANTEKKISLEDAYFSAIEHNETILIQQEVINQSAEIRRQAVGSILPTIIGTANYTQQPPPNNALTGGLYPTSQPLVSLTLTQPLFQGLAEYAVLRQTKAQNENQVELKNQAELTLYLNVANNFYTIASQENDLKNLTAEIGYYGERISELKHRVTIGKSQLSDVLSTETTASGLEAQVKLIQGQIAANREMFEYYTGLDRRSNIHDSLPYPAEPAPIEEYIQKMYDRPDIKANQLSMEAIHENINIAQAGHLPTINFFADYYFLRYGSLSEINWDLGVRATIPIFSGGNVQSKMRLAASQERQSTLVLHQSQRLAEAQIKSYYKTLVADQAQVKAYKMAFETAEKNYLELVREYRLGLVANVDVLLALANFQENRRALDKEIFVVKLDWANLQQSVGKKPGSVQTKTE